MVKLTFKSSLVRHAAFGRHPLSRQGPPMSYNERFPPGGIEDPYSHREGPLRMPYNEPYPNQDFPPQRGPFSAPRGGKFPIPNLRPHELGFEASCPTPRPYFSSELKTIDYGHRSTQPVSYDYGHGSSLEKDKPLTLVQMKYFEYGHGGSSESDDWKMADEKYDNRPRSSDGGSSKYPGRKDRDDRFHDQDYRVPPERTKRKGHPSTSNSDVIKKDLPKPNNLPIPKPKPANPHEHLFTGEVTQIKDLLMPPSRFHRPTKLVIILRGPPGSGKSHIAKLIKEKEVEQGGSAPRVLALDDYFMVESEVSEKDPETGKTVKRQEFNYEFEAEMESSYQMSLFKSFKKTVDDRFFPFIIVDAINDKIKQIEEYWNYAKQESFQVYVAEMDNIDSQLCHKRNIHSRSLEDIDKIIRNWQQTPKNFLRIDICSLLQDDSIQEVEMEDTTEEKKDEDKPDSETEDEKTIAAHVPSKWEKIETTEEKLDKLDGLRVPKKKDATLEDYLQLPDDYEERKSEPGKKRVRWADLEEKKNQDKLRSIGFVVGHTDWSRMTDPSHAEKALTKTKYI